MADIRWNNVNANFGDANTAMSNAQRGISNAGTVFGELRKSILDEEQRAIANAFREKEFDEKVRQFGLQQGLNEQRFGLDKEKFDEDIRRFGIQQDMAERRFGLDERRLNADLARLDIERQRQATAQKMGDLQYLIAQNQFNEAQELKQQSQFAGRYLSATPDQRAEIFAEYVRNNTNGQNDTLLNWMNNVDNALASSNISANDRANLVIGLQAMSGNAAAWEKLAGNEKALIDIGLNTEKTRVSSLKADDEKFETAMKDISIDDQRTVRSAIDKMVEYYPNLSRTAALSLLKGQVNWKTKEIQGGANSKPTQLMAFSNWFEDDISAQAFHEAIQKGLANGRLTLDGKPDTNILTNPSINPALRQLQQQRQEQQDEQRRIEAANKDIEIIQKKAEERERQLTENSKKKAEKKEEKKKEKSKSKKEENTTPLTESENKARKASWNLFPSLSRTPAEEAELRAVELAKKARKEADREKARQNEEKLNFFGRLFN